MENLIIQAMSARMTTMMESLMGPHWEKKLVKAMMDYLKETKLESRLVKQMVHKKEHQCG